MQYSQFWKLLTAPGPLWLFKVSGNKGKAGNEINELTLRLKNHGLGLYFLHSYGRQCLKRFFGLNISIV